MKISLPRLECLMAVRRLAQVSPSYNAELVIKQFDGRLSFSSFGEGIVGIEITGIRTSLDEEVVVALDKFKAYLEVRYEDTVDMDVKERSIRLSAGRSSATINRTTVRLQVSVPDESLFAGEISSSAFNDLARVANISDDKDLARPILGGVYIMLSNGDIRSVSANGIAFGYAWEQNNGITSQKKEAFLIKATSLSVAQRYDWQGEPKIKIYRPSDSPKMVCFSNGISYLYLSELAEKEKFPIDYLIKSSSDSVSNFNFTVDGGMFTSYVDAAVKLSQYDDRSVTVSLLNEKVMILSGKMLKSEIEEKGMEFKGFFEIMETQKAGDDFTFCLDAKMAKQAMALLAQVDKGGKLRVALGRETRLIFFSTSLANALYGISQIVRQ